MLSAIYPCPKLILCSKMLIRNESMSKNIFYDIGFVLKYLLIEQRSRNKMISYEELSIICDEILQKLKEWKKYQ